MVAPINTITSLLETVSPSYYDLVLAFVPSAFIVAILVGHVFSIPSHLALAAAATITVFALFDVMFLKPPRGSAGREGSAG